MMSSYQLKVRHVVSEKMPLSLLVLHLLSPLDSIQRLHRTAECKFLLIDKHWCVHA